MALAVEKVKALTFDVFGTCVDWHGSIVREVRALAREKGWTLDPVAFADAWRAGYKPAMQRVRSGELPWTRIDDLHRMILDDLIRDFRLKGLTAAEKDHLNRVWHRLKPWPDTVPGLRRLKRDRIIASLSNGNVGLLVNMAKNGGLPWDMVFSAEVFRHYKPDPETYLGAADLLGLKPGQVMLVASHKDDLDHARKHGLRTALVLRPKEFGPHPNPDAAPDRRYDLCVESFTELAERLGS